MSYGLISVTFESSISRSYDSLGLVSHKAPAGNMAMLAIWPTAPISVSERRNIFPFL